MYYALSPDVSPVWKITVPFYSEVFTPGLGERSTKALYTVFPSLHPSTEYSASLYSTSEIFNSVFAALTPPDHFSSFFSHSIVCMALERRISALKLVRRLHFSPRDAISEEEGNVFSKALCLGFWICVFRQRD